ncbi:hypothetical protein RvY_18711 [Ramazzottius varieornatus]|uniref:Winged helix-turn helix domain-containing protein n=1 Tax=Ramazzottius varieornatus TaxID=947166 RepID=A0A1D1W6S5_RAMVA|nr:hypothetical protein RvY_18711 [Ramazzottius varieornatus]
MSSSSSLYPVDVRHIAHLWKVLGQSFFGSNKYTLTTLAGRRKAIAHLCQRSPRTIQNITTSRALITGPPSGTAAESNTVPEDDVNETLDPVVEAEEMEGVAGVGRHLLKESEYGKIRAIIHREYKSKIHITVESLLPLVEEEVGVKVSKSTMYRVLRRMGFRHRDRSTRHLFGNPSLKKNALIAFLDETWLNENYQFRKSWIELDKEKSTGTAEILCKDCGQSHPSGSGKRLVIFDVVTDRGFVPGCGLIWEASKHTEDYHGNFNYQNYEKPYISQTIGWICPTRKLPDLIKLWEESADIFKPEDFPKLFARCIKLEDDYRDIDTKEDRIEAVGDEQADEDVAEEGGDLEPLVQDLDDDKDLALLPF